MKQLFFMVAMAATLSAASQVVEPVKWQFSSSRSGDEMELTFTAHIDKGWHLYDTSLPADGPVPTQFIFEDSAAVVMAGELEKRSLPVEKFDATFNMNLRYYSDTAVFVQKIRLADPKLSQVKGQVTFMACDDHTCLPPNDVAFSFATGTPETPGQAPAAQESGAAGGGRSPWLFVLLSLAAGLAAILTPCVFPMIPMTVSFFMRSSGNRAKAIRAALFFGLSIVGIYTLLGALFSFGVFGPNAGNILSTHWIPNALFFILFLVFSLSFFGLFEIVLPGSLVSKTDAKADQGGFAGAFFMALTTVIVSFSCTGPFIGALIIEAVQEGGLRPLLGMFLFGLAFALPFTLLAIFPSALARLPKSGGWLNGIKVFFAFILLAFGLKFLSNIDQVYGFNLFPREIYLSLWIVIFALMGLYFLGKIRFSHDSEYPVVGVGRFFLALGSFAFSLYLFTGLLGNPLKPVSSLLPPPSETAGMALPAAGQPAAPATPLCGAPKYGERLHLPHGLAGYFDYDQGIACAREQNKPAFIVFKGHACSNCKKMENSVWNDPAVLQLLTDKFVVIALYTDDRTVLPQEEQITTAGGKKLNTMGKVNLERLVTRYATNTIPYHVIVEQDGRESRLAVTYDPGEFRAFLEQAVE